MYVVPRTTRARIAFFESRLPVWGPEPGAIGLTPGRVAELAALTAEARAAHEAALAAREAAQAATRRQSRAVARMAAFGGDLVKTIRAHAETERDPAVYAAARIPAPARGGPLGPAPTPGVPTAALNADGSITLRWEAETRGRTAFIVERRTARPGQQSRPGRPGPWRLLGTAAARAFTDTAVPTGLASAEYRVTAERPGGRSEPTRPVAVLFGTAPAEAPAETAAAETAGGLPGTNKTNGRRPAA